MKVKMRKGYLILYAILFLALLYRSFLSVELTDEVHGIASIYNIYLGKKPFMTSWDYHTGWCLLAPLFRYSIWFPRNLRELFCFSVSYICYLQ